MTARIILLVTSPRLPTGLMTASAWDAVRAHPVLAGAESELTDALRAVGVSVSVPAGPPVDALLTAAGSDGTAVWLGSPAGDHQIARDLGMRLVREPGLAEMELLYGSWDPPGARLLDAVAVLDRLVSPDGDPWLRELAARSHDAAQPHRSLAQYLVEECYEAVDAISAGDLGALKEELGDLLLQIVLHARLAEELPEGDRWSVDDVAGGLVEKMIRRNPHVFGDAAVGGIEDIIENWEQIKRAEKSRDSAMDGIALAQPALSLAAKILSRARRAAIDPLPPLPAAPWSGTGSARVLADDLPNVVADDLASVFADEASLGAALLTLVAEASRRGQDPEAALRRAALGYADQIRAVERSVAGDASTGGDVGSGAHVGTSGGDAATGAHAGSSGGDATAIG